MFYLLRSIKICAAVKKQYTIVHTLCLVLFLSQVNMGLNADAR